MIGDAGYAAVDALIEVIQIALCCGDADRSSFGIVDSCQVAVAARAPRH
jgi:hypothetical protein